MIFFFEIDTNIVMLEYKTFTCFQTICKCKVYIVQYKCKIIMQYHV